MADISPLPNHQATPAMPGSRYLTVSLSVDAPSADVLEALVNSKLTDNYKERFPEYWYENYRPLPCLRTDFRRRAWHPRAFTTAPRSLHECITMCGELIAQGRKTMRTLTDFRIDRIEKHYGPFPDFSKCMVDTHEMFEETLPPAPTEETRAANQRLLDDHEQSCQRNMRGLYDTCNTGREILEKIAKRFADIEYWAKRSIQRGHVAAMPPRLAMVFVEVGVWHNKVKAAAHGFQSDWEEAQVRHAHYAIMQRYPGREASADQDGNSEADTERGEEVGGPRTPVRHNLE